MKLPSSVVIVKLDNLINKVIIGPDISPGPELSDDINSVHVVDQDHEGNGQGGGPTDSHLAVDYHLASTGQSCLYVLGCWTKVGGYVTP